jgi:hypothetical protein
MGEDPDEEANSNNVRPLLITEEEGAAWRTRMSSEMAGLTSWLRRFVSKMDPPPETLSLSTLRWTRVGALAAVVAIPIALGSLWVALIVLRQPAGYAPKTAAQGAAIPVVGANPVPAPYASTLTHANFLTDGLSTAGACISTTSGNVTTYANPGGYKPGCVIPGGLSIKNATVNLSPGTYRLIGGLNLRNGSGAAILKCTNCTNGDGVTIMP